MKKLLSDRGFSLIELLVAISIIAILATIIAPNLVGARQRARDAKRKAEAAEFKTALRMYYTDYQNYPTASGGLLGSVCGSSGNGACGTSFEVRGNTYMKLLPADMFTATPTMEYYSDAGENYCIVATLDNAGDGDIATSQSRCSSICGTTLSVTYSTTTDYLVCQE